MSFPSCCKQIPKLEEFTIYVDDAMRDDEFTLVYLEIDRSELCNEHALFGWIEGLFMNVVKVTEFKHVEVTCNSDAALNLQAFINSWLQEKKRQGSYWKGA